MKIEKKKAVVIIIMALMFIGINSFCAYAAPNNITVPPVNISIGNGQGEPQDYVSSIKILLFFTVLSILPSLVIMVTSFTRIIVVLSLLKNALGAAQALPAQVITGLALFLTLFIMQPVYSEMNKNAIQPYLKQEINQEEAIQIGTKPLKEFMLKQTRQKDLKLFLEISGSEKTTFEDSSEIPITTLIPAFAISELNTAFQIGFLIYLPFIIMDMVIGSVLMSMGMMMLPPAMVSLPFKLLLFVMVDGWYLLTKALVISFS